jgi:hypothetical protein
MRRRGFTLLLIVIGLCLLTIAGLLQQTGFTAGVLAKQRRIWTGLHQADVPGRLHPRPPIERVLPSAEPTWAQPKIPAEAPR